MGPLLEVVVGGGAPVAWVEMGVGAANMVAKEGVSRRQKFEDR